LLVTDGGSAISGSAILLVVLRALGGVAEWLTMSACYYM
jgi:hypothetical protein